MSEAHPAVFLSYASQDTDAARCISTALRAAGVEVWFDADGGLEHGDEWDAKIRKQVKECVLFIAVISAHTQAREEGYFRIEWDLAAERARGFASGVAFILPVVIDDTREPEALVPERFRAVQWTRIPGGIVTPEVQSRFLKLWSHRSGVIRHAKSLSAGAEPIQRDLPPTSTRRPSGKQAVIACVVLLVAGAAVWRPWSNASLKPQSVASNPAAVKFPQDPELKRALKLIFSLDAIGEDYALAEDIVKPVLAARPNDPDVVTVAAMVSQEYVTRGFDTSEAKRTIVQRLTERAVQLAPDNPEALAALARYLVYMHMQLPRARELAGRALELDPNEPRFHRIMLQVLGHMNLRAERTAFAAQMVARFPTNALVHYDLAREYKDENNLVGAERELDRTLVIAPVAFAMVWKCWLALEVHGDVVAMKMWLDRVPERQRTNTRYAYALSTHAAISGETAAAIKVLEDLPNAWLSDFDFNAPKALLLGDLLAISGRKDLAGLQYQTALAEIKRQEGLNPADVRPHRAELWTLLGLGRRDDARASWLIFLESEARPYHITLNNSWWSGPIRASLLLGERDRALELLREAASEATSRMTLRNQLRLDPRMKPYLDDPGINAVLAEPTVEASVRAGQ